jgi:hypothetical protein
LWRLLRQYWLVQQVEALAADEGEGEEENEGQYGGEKGPEDEPTGGMEESGAGWVGWLHPDEGGIANPPLLPLQKCCSE